MESWITAHPLTCIALYYLFSAIVGGMPEPEPNGSPYYLWLFNSLHIIAGNLNSLARVRYPALPPPQLPPPGTIQVTSEKTLTLTPTQKEQ